MMHTRVMDDGTSWLYTYRESPLKTETSTGPPAMTTTTSFLAWTATASNSANWIAGTCANHHAFVFLFYILLCLACALVLNDVETSDEGCKNHVVQTKRTATPRRSFASPSPEFTLTAKSRLTSRPSISTVASADACTWQMAREHRVVVSDAHSSR